MNELQQELDRLLCELAELDRCSACRDEDSGNVSLMIISRRATKTAIAEVRRLMGHGTSAH